MRVFTAMPGMKLLLGKQGENLATQYLFPIVKQWKCTFGDGGYFQLYHRRPGDDTAYVCPIEVDNNNVMWTITNIDTGVVGEGACELRYIKGETLAKSYIWTTVINESINEESPIPPEPWKPVNSYIIGYYKDTETFDIDAGQIYSVLMSGKQLILREKESITSNNYDEFPIKSTIITDQQNMILEFSMPSYISDTSVSVSSRKLTIVNSEILYESYTGTVNDGLTDYNDLLNKPIVNADLTTITPLNNTYYRHTGENTSDFTQGIVYLYNNNKFFSIDNSLILLYYNVNEKKIVGYTPEQLFNLLKDGHKTVILRTSNQDLYLYNYGWDRIDTFYLDFFNSAPSTDMAGETAVDYTAIYISAELDPDTEEYYFESSYHTEYYIPVKSVNGKNPIGGNVNITKSDIGLDKVGNFKSVSTEANQGLTDTEKTNAKANLDITDFLVINVNVDDPDNITCDKPAEEIKNAYFDGKQFIANIVNEHYTCPALAQFVGYSEEYNSIQFWFYNIEAYDGVSIVKELGIYIADDATGPGGMDIEFSEYRDLFVQSVNGQTGSNVTLTKDNIGLGNVDNTSDSNKPISTATQTALNGKADKMNIVSLSGPTSIVVEDNTYYKLQYVQNLAIQYPSVFDGKHYHFNVTFAQVSSVAMNLPIKYIGTKASFAPGETWEIDILDGVYVAEKVRSV